MSSRRPRVKVAANLNIRRAPKASAGEQQKTLEVDAITSCTKVTAVDSTEGSAQSPVSNVPAESGLKVDEVPLKLDDTQDKQEKQEKQEKPDEQHFKLPKPVDDVPKNTIFHNYSAGVDSSSNASQNSNTTPPINNNNNNYEEPMSPRKQEARFGFPFPLSRKRNRTESLTSNKSLPEGITVNKVPRKVATKQEESQRTQENKKEARKRLTNIDNVNKQNLTMFELIFYNPVNNPMETPTLCKRGSLENISKAVEGRKSRSVSKSRSPTPAPAPAQAVVPKALVQLTPQLKLGPNGEMILDEASLVIENEREKEIRETLANNEILYQDEFSGNSGYYSRIRRTKDWSNEETIRFYRCLHTIGTDFSMMLTLFPCRSRRDLKLKFKKEERLNLQLVNKALQHPKEFNLDELKQQFAAEDEELERIKEEQQLQAEEMQKKLRQEKLNKKTLLGISKCRNPKKRVTKSERALMIDATEEKSEQQDVDNTNTKPKRQRRKKADIVTSNEESLFESPNASEAVENVAKTNDSVSVKGEDTIETIDVADHSLTKADDLEPSEQQISSTKPTLKQRKPKVKRGTWKKKSMGPTALDAVENVAKTNDSVSVKGEDTIETTDVSDHSLTKADDLEPSEQKIPLTKPTHKQRKPNVERGTWKKKSMGSTTLDAVENVAQTTDSVSVKGEDTIETTDVADHSLTKVDDLEPSEKQISSTKPIRKQRKPKFKRGKWKKKWSIPSSKKCKDVKEDTLEPVLLDLPEPVPYIPNGVEVEAIPSSNTPTNAVETNGDNVNASPNTSTVCQPSTSTVMPIVEIPAALVMAPVQRTTPVIMLDSLAAPSGYENVNSSEPKRSCLINELTPIVIKYDETETDLEYLPLPGANAPVARKVRLDAHVSCALDDSREPLLELEPAVAAKKKISSTRESNVANSKAISPPNHQNSKESPTVTNTSPPKEEIVGDNLPEKTASPAWHKVESHSDPPALVAFPKTAIDDDENAAEDSEEDQCYVADEPIPEGDDDYQFTKEEELDVTNDGYLCETVAEITIGKEEISAPDHVNALLTKEISSELTKDEEEMLQEVDLTDVDVEDAPVKEADGLVEVAAEDEDGVGEDFSLADIDINSLVLVESQDANRPDRTIYEIYVVNPDTGQLSEKPLDVPADVIGNIRAILEASDEGAS